MQSDSLRPDAGTARPEAILDALDPDQRAVAEARVGPVCVLAGAGTGKTRAITHRIAYHVLIGTMAPSQILALTFTNRAAGEMRGRLRQLGADGVQARTFHAAAMRQLQFFWPKAVGGPPPTILDSKIALVNEAATRCRLRLDRTELRDLTGEVEWAKVSQVAPDDYAAASAKAARQPPRGPEEISRIYAAYEELKRDRGLIDFEDVLLLTVAMLVDRPDIADTVRSQYRHFVVDEYQDVSPLQQRLLDLWLGRRSSLCVVGDAGQTIYSFTGATPEFLLNFPQRYPDATVVRLVRDYRSTPQVVRLANAVVAAASGVERRACLELVAQRPDGPEPTFTEYDDEVAEADAVARRISDLVAQGRRPADMAVLFRTNGQSQSYEQALGEAGVHVQLRGVERFFNRPEVREAVMLLRGAARGGARGDPALGGGRPGLAAEVRAVLSTRGWGPTPPPGSGAGRARWESLAALVALAEELSASRPQANLADLVAELDARAAVQHAPTVDGVTLASLHAAKGLEWDVVFLVGLTEGFLPISHAETDAQIEEERRLFYVGITRAREVVHLSWARARTPGGRGNRRPSRFLDGLRPGSAPGAEAPRRRAASAATPTRTSRTLGPVRCRICGRTLLDAVERKLGRCTDCPSDLDEALFDRLRTWRSDTARVAGLPAYCVFTDATLTAIAEARPATREALAVIPGVGRAKLDRYGAAVLELLNPS